MRRLIGKVIVALVSLQLLTALLASTGGATSPNSAVLGAPALATNFGDIGPLSCGSVGNCAAGGSYEDSSGDTQAFVVDETAGTWGNAEEVPGTASLNVGGNATVSSLSCGSAGNCAAGGSYKDSSGNTQAFVVDETAGAWATAEEVPGTTSLNVGGKALVISLSCGSADNCAAGGSYKDSSGNTQAFVVDETAGTWGNAKKVPGTAKLNTGGGAYVGSVSCVSVGNCTAGGQYQDSSGESQAFVVDETAGTWAKAEEVPGTASLNVGGNASVASLSCASAGNCSAAGSFINAGSTGSLFVVNETAGTWGNAERIQGTGRKVAYSGVTSVSCGSVGNCAIGGWYQNSVAIVVDETAGTWGKAEVVPGIEAFGGGSEVFSLSCASDGNCAAGGEVLLEPRTGPVEAYVVDETAGTWGDAEEVPGITTLGPEGSSTASVSCTSAGNCVAVGSYGDSSGNSQAFVVNETAGTWGNAEEIT